MNHLTYHDLQFEEGKKSNQSNIILFQGKAVGFILPDFFLSILF